MLGLLTVICNESRGFRYTPTGLAFAGFHGHHLGQARSDAQGGGQPGDDIGGRHVPVQQQHADEFTGAGGIADQHPATTACVDVVDVVDEAGPLYLWPPEPPPEDGETLMDLLHSELRRLPHQRMNPPLVTTAG